MPPLLIACAPITLVCHFYFFLATAETLGRWRVLDLDLDLAVSLVVAAERQGLVLRLGSDLVCERRLCLLLGPDTGTGRQNGSVAGVLASVAE
jgi:hypothetical protein